MFSSPTRAICFLKLNQYEEAKQDCDSALQLDPANKKAFYRRALAFKGLEVTNTLFQMIFFICYCFFTNIVCMCDRMPGLPVGQHRPPGGPPAGPQDLRGRARA